MFLSRTTREWHATVLVPVTRKPRPHFPVRSNENSKKERQKHNMLPTPSHNAIMATTP